MPSKNKPGCSDGGGCCEPPTCDVYLFDATTAVSESDWTRDSGGATFGTHSIDLDPLGRISLNSPVLSENNYSAILNIDDTTVDQDLRLYLGSMSVRIEWTAATGDYTLTLSDGTTTETRSGEGSATAPHLGICLNGSSLTGWSGLTATASGYGHLAIDTAATVSGSLEIENLGGSTVTITKVELTRAVIGEGYDTEECRECEPAMCDGCEGGWVPESYNGEISNVRNELSNISAGTACYDTEAGANSHVCDQTTRASDAFVLTGSECSFSGNPAVVAYVDVYTVIYPPEIGRCGNLTHWGVECEVEYACDDFRVRLNQSTAILGLTFKQWTHPGVGSVADSYILVSCEYVLPSPLNCESSIAITIGDMTKTIVYSVGPDPPTEITGDLNDAQIDIWVAP